MGIGTGCHFNPIPSLWPTIRLAGMEERGGSGNVTSPSGFCTWLATYHFYWLLVDALQLCYYCSPFLATALTLLELDVGNIPPQFLSYFWHLMSVSGFTVPQTHSSLCAIRAPFACKPAYFCSNSFWLLIGRHSALICYSRLFSPSSVSTVLYYCICISMFYELFHD